MRFSGLGLMVNTSFAGQESSETARHAALAMANVEADRLFLLSPCALPLLDPRIGRQLRSDIPVSSGSATSKLTPKDFISKINQALDQ